MVFIFIPSQLLSTNSRHLLKILRLIQYLSFKKTLNLAMLYAGYITSRIIRKPVIWGDPFAISIEPTTSCQLRCPECPTGNGTLQRNKGSMNLSTFDRIIYSIPPNTFFLNLYLQGEPFLHPHILEMIRIAKKRKLFTCIATNAQLIDEEMAENVVRSGLSKLILSLDGFTQQSYSLYRVNGSVEKVYDSIRFLKKAKEKLGASTPFVVAQMIVFNHNQHEIKVLKKRVSADVDKIEIKTAQFYEKENRVVDPPSKKKLTRYIPINGKLLMKTPPRSHCWRIFSSLVITWEGQMLPCCFDKDGNFPMGNISSTTIRYIWYSKKYNAFRYRLLTNRSSIPMCHNCTEGLRWYI